MNSAPSESNQAPQARELAFEQRGLLDTRVCANGGATMTGVNASELTSPKGGAPPELGNSTGVQLLIEIKHQHKQTKKILADSQSLQEMTYMLL